MNIFQAEIDDGLAEQINSSASISYASIAAPCGDQITNKLKSIKSLASLNDSDLYYVQSILVSSSWNKNDDIFDKDEIWVARNTPEDKPTNLEHDENTIIGHITHNWPITEDGEIISEDTDPAMLPEKYHILTGSVIYTAFTNPELKERAAKLIDEIENGNKFVSMECFFKGFDYGLINKNTGDYKVLARNNDTAYLTKYLRAYGGLGEHDNYKIGRVLRNITFSGKGFVEKPANPDSIIFTKDITNRLFSKKIDILEKTGVFTSQSTSIVENNIMSLEKEVVEASEANTEVTTVEAGTETTTTTDTSHNVADLQNIIASNEETIAALTSEVSDLKTKIEALVKRAKEDEDMKEEEKKTLKAELDQANETIAAYKNKEMEMMKLEKKNKRKAALLECGLATDEAEAAIEKFDSISDDAFSAMTAIFAAKNVKVKKTEDVKDAEDDKKTMSSESADASVLETVEVTETTNLSISADPVESVNSTRAELIEFVCARLGKKLNKGE